MIIVKLGTYLDSKLRPVFQTFAEITRGIDLEWKQESFKFKTQTRTLYVREINLEF